MSKDKTNKTLILKSCPFCGGQAEFVENVVSISQATECPTCHAKTVIKMHETVMINVKCMCCDLEGMSISLTKRSAPQAYNRAFDLVANNWNSIPRRKGR